MDISDRTSIDALVTYVKEREPLIEHDYTPGRDDRILALRFVLPHGGKRELAITPELWQHSSNVLSLTAGLSADTKRDVHTRIVPPRPSCPVPKAGLEGEMRHGAVFLTMGAGG